MTTIRDVAKKLNLSITTVSRALDGYDDVAADTRALVIQTAQKMRYTPNRAARQLRRQKSETIGFILPSNARRFDEPFFTEFISGLGNALSKQNYDLLIANAQDDEQEKNLYQRWIDSRKVDGFVLNRVRRFDWRVQMLSKAKIPFTALGKSQDDTDYPCIRIDGTQGYRELIDHLHGRGFKKFAFIGGIAELINHIDRLNWFKSALAQMDIKLVPQWLVSSDMTSSGGYAAAVSLLSMPKSPDAILCINDETAFGAIHAAHEHRLNIGEDIAITGFEGVQDSAHSSPPLTTLDLPVQDVASQLAEMLLARLNNKRPAWQEVRISPKLIIRESTGG